MPPDPKPDPKPAANRSSDLGASDSALGDLIRVRAHAKVNHARAVDGAIPEGPHAGMHPIASWMAPIALADEVEIRRTPDGSSHDIAWADGSPVGWDTASDLAVRAHAALEHAVGRPLGAHITVRKLIPAGGGLGGGSADAAAVLRGLDRLYALDLGTPRLRAIAATLGSDIPFFIPDRSVNAPSLAPSLAPPQAALVTGMGEIITPATVRGDAGDARTEDGIPIVLVFPPFGCPTGDVYRAFDDDPPAHFCDDEVRSLAASGVVDSASLFNDLAPPACRVQPALKTIREDLAARMGAPVHVSGSGSTLFCLGCTSASVSAHLPERCVAVASFVLCSLS